MKVIYLHGFNSDGDSRTVKNLRKKIPDLISVSYDYILADQAYEKIRETIKETIKEDADIILVGTSLGAFWANYFNQKFGLKSVLVNPSLYPWISLAKYIGLNKNFNSGEERVLTVENVAAYKKYEIEIILGYHRTVVLGTKDDVIDYRETEKAFENKAEIILVNEGHRIENTDRLVKIIIDVDNWIAG